MATKRINPYAEDFIQQSKIHVSLKQFNNNEHRLQKVYEKTLALLFKGANRSQDESKKTNLESVKQRKKDGKKQLFIGKDGTLLHSGFTVPEVTEAGKCLCGNLKSEYCSYCESALCASCQLHCQQCMQFYCSKCFLTGLDNKETCVSCYS